MDDIPALLERFRRGAELVAVAVTGAAGSELDFVPSPGRWSVRQILCHVADAELVAADRIRRTIAEDNPTLIGYDQEAWARNLDYTRRRSSAALESFRRLRQENHQLLKDLPASAFERPATHSERGAMTLLDLLKNYVDHAENHARQMRDVREAFKSSRRA